MYLILIILAATLVIATIMQNMGYAYKENFTGIMSSDWDFSELWDILTEQYTIHIGYNFFDSLYSIYDRLTVANLLVLFLKCGLTSIYLIKFVKNVYTTSRERYMQKRMELDDIQLQIEIVNTKLSVRDAELQERSDEIRRGTEKLQRMKARVRELIASDENLRRCVNLAAARINETETSVLGSTREEDQQFIDDFIKEINGGNSIALPDLSTEKFNCGENINGLNTAENSGFSSLNDSEGNAECRVKIVKVTNVYKVAVLKHFIKQRKMNKDRKHAILKKKMENIKKQLDGWQETLNAVINTRLSVLNPNQTHTSSQEANADHSKPNLRDISDSDSDLKTDDCEEYNSHWSRSPLQNYGYECDDVIGPDSYFDSEYNEKRYHPHGMHQCECNNKCLFILPEETSSQIAIEY